MKLSILATTLTIAAATESSFFMSYDCFQEIVETYESTYQDHFKCFYADKTNTGKKFAKCVFTLPDQGKRDFWGCRVDITKDIQAKVQKQLKKGQKPSKGPKCYVAITKSKEKSTKQVGKCLKNKRILGDRDEGKFNACLDKATTKKNNAASEADVELAKQCWDEVIAFADYNGYAKMVVW